MRVAERASFDQLARSEDNVRRVAAHATQEGPMNEHRQEQRGRTGALLLWLVGVPVPAVMVLYMLFH